MEIDVRHIAKLAMLKIPEEQVEAFEKELSGIVAMVENLPEIPSAATLLEPGNVMELREDAVVPRIRGMKCCKTCPRPLRAASSCRRP